jgi:pimeloyl-ACP methyl ester carboxylesterase
MKRTTFLGTVGSAVAMVGLPFHASAAESDITLKTPTGTIYGTLSVPGANAPVPVVLIIAASGPTDRNGNQGMIQANTYKLLAQALAKRGIASLRYDKRGVGESVMAAGSEQDLRFQTYANDAAAWLDQLHADKRFSRSIIAGHSEGSLLGMLAAQQAPASAFVSLEGAGRPAAVVLREQLKPKLPADLYAQSELIIGKLLEGRTVANVPQQLAALFRPSVQPYLISWFKVDPAAEIAKLAIPVTIVQGTADVQVSIADADALAKANPKAKLVVVQGMNHMLKYAPDTSSQQAILKGYEDPSLPIVPKAVDAVAAAART